ncbi:MAG: TetR family transcriptional regulator [Alphaproteobacteria bacterium]|nr:TetR family transcriptional regulator [Alphaproteobacteria bacterium]
MQDDAPRSPGRPKDEAKRQAILDAARELFFQRGVEGVAIEQIALAAGVSKMTIYNNFGDKEALFEAVVSQMADKMEAGLADLEFGDMPLREALQHFGETLLQHLFSEELIQFDPLLAMEAGRHASMAKRFFKAGPGRMREALARGLSARIKRGELAHDDPMVAAEDLISLWQGMWPIERRFLHMRAPTRDEISARVAHAIAFFLKVYSVK